jgi:hypothetical protein
MKLAQLLLSVGLLLGGVCTAVQAQMAPARTWPELKQAVQERVNAQRYPMTGFDAKQVAEILQRIQSLDRDEWARAWIQTGDVHARHAQSLSSSQPALAAEAYLSAWRYYGFGAWPTQNAAEKKRAHALGTQAFRAYAALAQPKIEVLRIPFEGREIVGYLQRPVGVAKPPVVLSVGGLDSYKEFVVEQFVAMPPESTATTVTCSIQTYFHAVA